MNNQLEKLVQNLFKEGVIKSEIVKQVLLSVDRKQFVDEFHQMLAYEDYPIQIGFNATISVPHMHAYSLELLKDYLQNGVRALDIGSGSGYLYAAMFQMMKSQQSKVIGTYSIVIKYRLKIQACKVTLLLIALTINSQKINKYKLSKETDDQDLNKKVLFKQQMLLQQQNLYIKNCQNNWIKVEEWQFQ